MLSSFCASCGNASSVLAVPLRPRSHARRLLPYTTIRDDRRAARASEGAMDRSVPHRRRPRRPLAAGARAGPARLEDPFVGWTASIAITLLALFLRLWKLGTPHAFEFDETYYAKDAWSLWHFGYARDYVDNDGGSQQAHPRRPDHRPVEARRRRWSCTPRSASG